MNAVQVLNFQQNSVRTVADNKGELWFLANDVCEILGYTNPRRTVDLHCKSRGVTKRYTPTTSGEQEMTYINEPNLYRLIIKSRKPAAEAFEEWVMETVLPTIRKTGGYQVGQKTTADDRTGLRQAVAALVG
ncbi:BRO-N domain-containing protein, partial [Neisseria gonorrhoeae]